LATKVFASKINALGADYIDAPVSGSEVGAKAASPTIMCGGDAAVFEKVRPLLEKMGKNITLVGGNGDGQTTKVANQIIVALNIAAVGEALLFASKAGADPAKVRQALMGGFASSRRARSRQGLKRACQRANRGSPDLRTGRAQVDQAVAGSSLNARSCAASRSYSASSSATSGARTRFQPGWLLSRAMIPLKAAVRP
jgi:3-hydroxyisobutyrate dehydrogenase-like beta-hydroxyacid dehydrogenase